MTRTVPVLIVAAFAGASGCQNHIGNEPIHDDRGAYNAWTIETVNDGAVRNAIIAQHTLYPYHFVDGASELNDLGRRDVGILASHYKRYPGQVSVRRGGEDPTMYQARVKAVADTLVAGGVAPNTVRIADAMPGGEGTSANRVVIMLEGDDNRLRTAGAASNVLGVGNTGSGMQPSSTGGSSSSSSSSSGNYKR